MALVKTNLNEINKYEPLPPDVYTVEITAVNENVLNKQNVPGTEIFLKVLNKGTLRGREATMRVSSKFLSPLFKLAAACLGKQVEDLADANGDLSVDPAALPGLKCRALIKNREHEGRTYNDFSDFYPAEVGAVGNDNAADDGVF